MKRYLICLTLWFAYALPVRAGDWLHAKQACQNMFHGFTRFTAEDCGLKLFGLEPIGPEVKNIGSGSGLGGGLRFIQPINHNHLQSEVVIRSLVSVQHFTLV